MLHGIYPKKLKKHVYTKISSRTLGAALLIIAKPWKQPRGLPVIEQ
jgi:hypothetical protein